MVLGVVCHKVDKPNLYFFLYHNSGNILANPRVVGPSNLSSHWKDFPGLPDFTSKSLFFRGMGCALPLQCITVGGHFEPHIFLGYKE